jgi:hypothetical protein
MAPLLSVRRIAFSPGTDKVVLDTSAIRKWFVGQQVLNNCRLRVALAGRLDLRKTDYPEFEFVGSGELELFSARVEGSAAIAARQGKISTTVQGSLTWQKRE